MSSKWIALIFVFVMQGCGALFLKHADSADAATASSALPLSVLSADNSTRTPSFRVAGLPIGSTVELLLNADVTCSNGFLYQL